MLVTTVLSNTQAETGELHLIVCFLFFLFTCLFFLFGTEMKVLQILYSGLLIIYEQAMCAVLLHRTTYCVVYCLWSFTLCCCVCVYSTVGVFFLRCVYVVRGRLNSELRL